MKHPPSAGWDRNTRRACNKAVPNILSSANRLNQLGQGQVLPDMAAHGRFFCRLRAHHPQSGKRLQRFLLFFNRICR
jgi:hypothetical protein